MFKKYIYFNKQNKNNKYILLSSLYIKPHKKIIYIFFFMIFKRVIVYYQLINWRANLLRNLQFNSSDVVGVSLAIVITFYYSNLL